MRMIEDNFDKAIKNPTVIILGSFDGIHCGHRELVKSAKELALKIEKKNNIEKVNLMVCTFKNHPLSVINKELCPKLIMDNKEKCKLFEKLNIDIVNFMDFNEELMKISPEDFIKSLKVHYNAMGIVVGFNYRFGYKNLGDVELLSEYSEELNYELMVVKPVKIGNEVVSSSTIRHYIQEGNIMAANEFLNRPFMLSGEVVHGRQIGRTINFPTLNLNYNKDFVVPQGGVYGSIVQIEGKLYKGITNIGYNPTVNGNKLSIETYVINFSKDVYGEVINVYFIEKIRDEKKFKSVEKLKAQLETDKNYIYSSDYNEYIIKIQNGLE